MITTMIGSNAIFLSIAIFGSAFFGALEKSRTDEVECKN